MKHIFYLLAFLAQSCNATNKEIIVDGFRREIHDILYNEATEMEDLTKETSKMFYENIHKTQPTQDIENRWEFLWKYAANHKMTGTLAKIISTTNEYSKYLKPKELSDVNTTNEYSKDPQPKELSDVLKEEIIAAAMPEGWDTIDITGITTEGIYYKSASGCDCFMPTTGAALSNLLLLYADFTLKQSNKESYTK